MPGSNGAGSPSSDLELESPGHSRRSLLKGAATVGVAGIATARGRAYVSCSAAATRCEQPRRAALAHPAGTAPVEGSEQIVVHVRDIATGEMDVFRGTTCTRVRDTQLAARLSQAAR